MHFSGLFIVLLLTAVLGLTLVPTGPGAGKGEAPAVVWKQVGIGEGGATLSVAVHPRNPEHILFFNDMGSSYWSEDGGKSYHPLRDVHGEPDWVPRNAQEAQFCRATPAIVFAAALGGVYKSTDGGKTWEVSFAKPGSRFTSLAIDPNNGNHVWAGTGNHYNAAYGFGHASSSPLSVVKTQDGGKTWVELNAANGLPKQGNVFSLQVDPKNPKVVYAATDKGLFKSTDGGNSWQVRGTESGLPHQGTTWAVRASQDKEGRVVLYLLVEPLLRRNERGEWVLAGGVYRSANQGESWEDASGDLRFGPADYRQSWEQLQNYTQDMEGNQFHYFPQNDSKPVVASAIPSLWLMEVDAHNPKVLYVGSRPRPGVTLALPPCGIYKTTDGGIHWEFMGPASRHATWLKNNSIKTRENEYDKDNVQLSRWLVEKYRSPAAPNGAQVLGICQANPNVVYTAGLVAAYRSVDGGAHWEDINTDEVAPYKFKGRGNSNVAATGILYDPFDPRRILLYGADVGVWYTEDEGATTGFARNLSGWSAVAVYDPTMKGVVYAADIRSKFYRSTDGGRTFQELSEPYALFDPSQGWSYFVAIAVDPSSPESRRCIYVAASSTVGYKTWIPARARTGVGIAVSEDGGRTWQRLNEGLPPGNDVIRLLLHPRHPNLLFTTVMKGRMIEGKLDENSPGGLFRMDVRQERKWRRVSPDWMDSVWDMDINPKKPDLMYLSVLSSPAGVYKSSDGGKTWQKVLDAQHPMAVKSSPLHPEVVFASNWWSLEDPQKTGVFVSFDGGKTWTRRNKGLSLPRPATFTFHPTDPHIVWVGTGGGGWYRGEINR